MALPDLPEVAAVASQEVIQAAARSAHYSNQASDDESGVTIRCLDHVGVK